MKKLLLLALPLLLVACEDDYKASNADAKIWLDQSEINLTVGNATDIKAGATNEDIAKKLVWSSADSFAVYIDKTGHIEARHVGKTIVAASYQSLITSCDVTVAATYKNYETPFLALSKTKKAVEDGLTSAGAVKAAESTDAVLVYDKYPVGASKTKYTFVNKAKGSKPDSLVQVEVLLPTESVANLDKFITERYELVDGKYIDHYKLKDATMVVVPKATSVLYKTK